MPKKQDTSKKASYDRIRELEEEISKTKYNKRTQRHIGFVKAKIAVLKEKPVKRQAGKGKQEYKWSDEDKKEIKSGAIKRIKNIIKRYPDVSFEEDEFEGLVVDTIDEMLL